MNRLMKQRKELCDGIEIFFFMKIKMRAIDINWECKETNNDILN